LRDELVAPPFGLPACTLAIFAAVAVRDEVKRLRWGSTNETDFAANLTAAFELDSKLTIRLFEFSNKQLDMLFSVGRCFGMDKDELSSQEEFAVQCLQRLKQFVTGQPDSIKTSTNLGDPAKRLVKIFQAVAKTHQEIADALICLLELEHESSGNIVSLGCSKLKELLDDFEKVSSAKHYQIKQSVQTVLPTNPENKNSLIANLNHHSASNEAKSFARLLEEHGHADGICPDKITRTLLNKSIEDCTETEIGRCQGKLEALVAQHQQPPQDYLPANQVAEPITTKTQLVSALQKFIQGCGLANGDITAALRTVLAEYE